MLLNKTFKNIFCINLKFRKQKRKHMKEQAKYFNLTNMKFFNAIANKKNPAKGCLQSHLELIKMAKKNNWENILILEDDCDFKEVMCIDFPEDWDMVYFGANVNHLIGDDYISDANKDQWVRAAVWTTHCYAINNTMYDILIEGLQKTKEAIDKYYCMEIHPKYNCYTLDNMIAGQRDCYSDIEGKQVAYCFKTPAMLQKIKMCRHEMLEEEVIKVKNNLFTDEELPKVSILTPTYNRRKFFKLAISNFLRQDYPKDKLEWVILDDGKQPIKDLLPKDKRIRYVKIKTNKRLTIGKKRNLCVKYATSDYFVCMDDDDYYFDYSVTARIKTLLSNPGKELIGCSKLCCYSLNNKTTYQVGADHQVGEASIAFTRKFFEERKFNEFISTGEGHLFIESRKDRIVRMPFSFVMIVLNHKTNMTKDLRHADTESMNIRLPQDILDLLKDIQ